MDAVLSAKQTLLSLLIRREIHTQQSTKLVHQVPVIFHEPYIVRGYRPPFLAWYCYLNSLFQWHNETLNVWSHLAAAFWVLYQLLELLVYQKAADRPETWGLLGLGLGAFVCKMLSALAHLFCSRSPMAHHVMYQVDYIGVSLNAQATGLFLYFMAGDETFYRECGWFFLAINTLLAAVITVCCTISKLAYSQRPFPPQRALWCVFPCALSAFYHSLPLCYKLYKCFSQGETPDQLLLLHFGVPTLFGLSAFFYASHVPERLSAGKFDLAVNSHTIFHVVFSFGTMLQFYLGRQELVKRPLKLALLAGPSVWSVFGWQMTLMAVGLLILLLTHEARLKNIALTEKVPRKDKER